MNNGKEGLVREIMMGSPVTLKPDDTLDLANDIISLGRIRHIPVVENGKLTGMISARDLMGAASSIMKKRVVTVEPDTPITNAARLMADKKIGCLPVVESGALVGLVTTTDVLRYVAKLD